MEWALRSATADDAEAVVALWRESGAEPTSTDDPASVRALIERDPSSLIVAESDGRIVGTLIAGFDGWRGSLYRLVVRPDLRRHGLATAIVGEAERRLVGLGARRANALVVQDHAHAVGFWKAAGYEHDPRMDRFVRNVGG